MSSVYEFTGRFVVVVVFRAVVTLLFSCYINCVPALAYDLNGS